MIRVVVGVAVAAAAYLVLFGGSLAGSVVVVGVAAAVGFLAEALLWRIETRALAPRLRYVGADAMWRAFLRQSLVAVTVVRTGHLSGTAAGTLIGAVIARQLLAGLYSGMRMVIDRLRLRRLETRNLAVPGAELPPPIPPFIAAHGRRAQQGGEALLLAGVLWAGASDSYRWVVPAAVAMCVVAALFPLALVRQLLALHHLPDDEHRLAIAQQAVFDLQPLVILYFSGGLGAFYQVNMWFETMERLGRPVLVVLRERRYWHRLPETSLPVLCMPFTEDLMNFDFGSARVALYVANVGRNIHLLRVPTLKSAFIGHGDSDKVASSNPYAKVYDEVWVAGEAGRQRYLRAHVGVREENLIIVGRPQLDAIQESAPRERGSRFTVLYAPTWEGWTDDPYASSLETMGIDIVDTLLADPAVRLVYRPHPLTGTVRRETGQVSAEICAKIARAGSPHVAMTADDMPLYDCFDESDALISDISSVVSDYLRSEKPYFVTNGANIDDIEFREENPSAGAAYLIGPGARGLREGLAAAQSDDPMRARRHEVRAYLLGDPSVEAITLFRAAVDRLAERAAVEVPYHAAAIEDADERLEQREGRDALSPVGAAGMPSEDDV